MKKVGHAIAVCLCMIMTVIFAGLGASGIDSLNYCRQIIGENCLSYWADVIIPFIISLLFVWAMIRLIRKGWEGKNEKN